MEAGWYSLAHQQFSLAIDLDTDYYMAYIGKVLSNQNLGYGMSDEKIGSYKERLKNISMQRDVNLRLSYQEQFLLQALVALHSGHSMEQGLIYMNKVFDENVSVVPDYILSVVRAYGLLITAHVYQPLAKIAKSENNVFALNLLVNNLNPYRVERRRLNLWKDAALSAVFTYQGLGIRGAQEIALTCVDIAEYYGAWSLAKTIVDLENGFLFTNIGNQSVDLFVRENEAISVRGLNVTYLRLSRWLVYKYERLHFYMLQVRV